MITGQIYLIGSLRNPLITDLGNKLRREGFDIFDDWMAAGPEADDHWQAYETARRRHYGEALAGAAARNVFEFDKRNLDASAGAILVMPAGKSGHLELGYMVGRDKYTAVLFDKVPDRYDVMYQFVNDICFDYGELIGALKR